jgi:DNA polymerase (family X)
MAREADCKIVVNTDAHHNIEMENMRYGIRQLRRAWLNKKDVLNTLPAKGFLPTYDQRTDCLEPI